MQRYSLGIQDFKELRTLNCVYVDKTEQIYQLLGQGKTYFYSHPRRFGKSLLLSTFKYLFQGRKELFEGLWIADKVNWAEMNYPVLHFTFIQSSFREIGLQKDIHSKIEEQANQYGISLTEEGISNKMTELVKKIHDKYQQKVVILVDEYDKPINEYLGTPEVAVAQENKQWLRNFYSPLKELDPYLRFLFITGITKFSKVSLFSDLNQLEDLTLASRAATLLGYTEQEIIHYFDERLHELAAEKQLTYEALFAKMRLWYNGYSWNGKDKVYNPTSILNFLKNGEFRNYWFETGTPTLLINLLSEDFTFNIEQMVVGAAQLSSFRLEQLPAPTLLFQTGYLTIVEQDDDTYILDYPNQEVRDSMLQYLLAEYCHQLDVKPPVKALFKAMQKLDFAQVIKSLNGLLGSIPYQLFAANQEKYYHAVIFLTFRLLGYYAQAEPSVSEGRIDAVVETAQHIFIWEFKVDGTVAEALQQIHNRHYYQAYAGSSKAIYLIGVVCKDKKIADYEVQHYQ